MGQLWTRMHEESHEFSEYERNRDLVAATEVKAGKTKKTKSANSRAGIDDDDKEKENRTSTPTGVGAFERKSDHHDNEEEGSTSRYETPPQHAHRVLDDDPRSPSTNVDRTPIEVDCTPKRSMSESSTPASTDSPSAPLLAKNDNSSKKGNTNRNSVKDSLHKRVLEKRMPLAARNNSVDAASSDRSAIPLTSIVEGGSSNVETQQNKDPEHVASLMSQLREQLSPQEMTDVFGAMKFSDEEEHAHERSV